METSLSASQLSYDLAVKQLNLQREDLRNVRNQAAFAAAIAGLIATAFSSMLEAKDFGSLIRGQAFVGLNLESILLFSCFFGAVAFAIRVQTTWQQVTFDLSPLFILQEATEGKSIEEIQAHLAKDADRYFDENESVIIAAQRNLFMSLTFSICQILRCP